MEQPSVSWLSERTYHTGSGWNGSIGQEGQIVFYCQEKGGKTWTPEGGSWLVKESRRLPHTEVGIQMRMDR